MHRHKLDRMTWSVCSLFFAALISGCGNVSLVPVTGTLLVDGEPAEGATLLFHPQSPAPSKLSTATTDASGKFSLVCEAESGIPVGSYKVSVIWPDPSVQPTAAQKMTGMFDAGPDLLKGRYESREKSNIVIEITSSTRELQPLELTKK
jgi:hypothetical protein